MSLRRGFQKCENAALGQKMPLLEENGWHAPIPFTVKARDGVTDLNQLKARLRCLMGACGGKTCTKEILRIFRALGIEAPAENDPPGYCGATSTTRLATRSRKARSWLITT